MWYFKENYFWGVWGGRWRLLKILPLLVWWQMKSCDKMGSETNITIILPGKKQPYQGWRSTEAVAQGIFHWEPRGKWIRIKIPTKFGEWSDPQAFFSYLLAWLMDSPELCCQWYTAGESNHHNTCWTKLQFMVEPRCYLFIIKIIKGIEKVIKSMKFNYQDHWLRRK